jgi:hypothetical protein
MVNYEGKSPVLWDTVRVFHLMKSDRGLRPAEVLWVSWTYGADCPAHKFELTLGLVGDVSVIN